MDLLFYQCYLHRPVLKELKIGGKSEDMKFKKGIIAVFEAHLVVYRNGLSAVSDCIRDMLLHPKI